MDSGKTSTTSRLDVATKAVSFNVLLQLLLRVSSFTLNGIILRYVRPTILGVVNLRWTLLYDTILFLAREPLRKAALSRSKAERNWRHIFNLLWLSVPVGVVLSLLLVVVWLSKLLPQPDVDWDRVGVVVYVISALIELPSEPLWVMAQDTGHVSIKVVAEGVSQGVRCIIVLVGVITSPQYGLLVFAAAQFLCSVMYVLLYYGYFARLLLFKGTKENLPISSLFNLLPQRGKQYFNTHLLTLSWSFFKQSVLKQLLTKGEQFVMTFFGVLSFAEQGLYDVINNLGSIVARVIFLPIEETFYVFFASTLVRGQPVQNQSKESVAMAGRVLSLLLKLVLLIALIIISFGYAYSHLALNMYGGDNLSSGSSPMLLRWYCVYVLFLAVNGITECFMFAAMSQEQVDRYNGSMLVFSAVFLAAAALLTRYLGSVGFILANCINMSSRIAHSCHFINSFFKSTSITPLSSAIPSPILWVVFPAVMGITTLSESMFCCSYGYYYRLIHILIGMICLAGVLLIILISESELCTFIIERLPTRIANVMKRLVKIIPGAHLYPVHHNKHD